VDLEPVEGSGGNLRISNSGIIIAFGKYKGRTLEEIQKRDPRYLKWLFSPSSPIPKSVSKKYSSQFID
jgi:ribosomal protein L24E